MNQKNLAEDKLRVVDTIRTKNLRYLLVRLW